MSVLDAVVCPGQEQSMTTAVLDRAPTRAARQQPSRAGATVVRAGRVAADLCSCGGRIPLRGLVAVGRGGNPPAYFLPDAAPVLIYGFLGVEVFFLITGSSS